MQRILGVHGDGRAVLAVVLAAVLTGSAGCSEETGEKLPVQQARAALTGPQQLSFSLPSSTGLPSAAVVASSSLRVADRVQASAPQTGLVAFSNTGTGATEIGNDAKVGSIHSQSSVVLRDRALVTGDVQSAGTISLGNGAAVTGQVKPLTPITPLQSFSWTVTFPAPGPNVNLEPDRTQGLTPGSYGDVSVKSRSTLHLAAGTYYLNSLSTEPQASLVLDSGPVFVYVASNLNLKGAINAGAQAKRFLVGYVGQGTVSLESPFTGTIVAPQATLRFAPSSPALYTGSFFARNVQIEPGATIVLQTFLDWSTLFPLPTPRPGDVHPTLQCVAPLGSGDYVALFGYVNDAFRSQRVRIGADNTFVPAPAGRGQIQRFLPGKTAAAFATRFDGTAVSWRTPGGSATASAQAPACSTAACTPACGAGTTCVGGSCVTLCGDGVCAGDEGCETCPPDCGCPTGDVCYHNGCGTPATCGDDWQCGAGTSLGVNVDCGSCPGGAACVNHVCQ